jgi:hypothetical protein
MKAVQVSLEMALFVGYPVFVLIVVAFFDILNRFLPG